jgi:hypothetical protein
MVSAIHMPSLGMQTHVKCILMYGNVTLIFQLETYRHICAHADRYVSICMFVRGLSDS